MKASNRTTTIMLLLAGIAFGVAGAVAADLPIHPTETVVGLGFSQSTVNTVIFRRNSVISFGDNQYISYYDPTGAVILGKRKHGESTWQTVKTQYKGDPHRRPPLDQPGGGRGRVPASFLGPPQQPPQLLPKRCARFAGTDRAHAHGGRHGKERDLPGILQWSARVADISVSRRRPPATAI